LDPHSDFQQWILNRNGFKDQQEASDALRPYKRILDAGCGNGRVTALLATLAPASTITGVDIIDLAVPSENLASYTNIELRTANLRDELIFLGTFDFIYCQEVLHHTGDAYGSFHNLVQILEKNGKIAIYVYKRKAVMREFMDDYLREKISGLPYEEAIEICEQITEFGRKLAVITTEIDLNDIPILGIEKGVYSPQRIIYNFFMKCFWNDTLSFKENAAINYDWYHPQNCSRHTMEEVLGWFHVEKLSVTWSYQDLYGITVHGVKEGGR